MNTIRKNVWRVLPAFAFLLTPASPVRAAPITWDAPTQISADTDVITSGSLLYAYTFGSPLGLAAGSGGRGGPGITELASVPSTTVNGVTFAPFAVSSITAGTVTVDSVSLATDPSGDVYYTSNTLAGSGTAPFVSLSASYQTLLQSGVSTFVFPSKTMTLTLGGLTDGQSYIVEFWSNDSGGLTQETAGTTYTAGNAITLDNNNLNADGGVGQWVTGNFTASGTSQVITIQSSSPSTDFPVINALEVRDIPEPGSLALLAMGVMGISGYARQRRRRSLTKLAGNPIA